VTAGHHHRRDLALAAGLAAADLLSKWWIFASIELEKSVAVLGSFFELRPVYNPRGPWSWGFSLPESVLRFGLPVLSVVAVFVLLKLMRDCAPAERAKRLGFALILGGAIGNLWDRALTAFHVEGYHGVRDFLVFPNIVMGDPFPAFNLADTWITVGVVLVAWCILFEKEPEVATGGAAG
jgi:signal peptidase II